MRMPNMLLPAAVLVALAGVSGTASAVDSTRTFFQNAAGLCKPALPAFDGNIRTRPLAVANEGSAVAFVSCSMPRAPGTNSGLATYGVDSVFLRFYNRTGAAADVGCTLVTAWDASNSNYIPKTLTVPANGNTFGIWVAADNGGTNIYNPNFSCSLPPGVDLGYGGYTYSVPVGA